MYARGQLSRTRILPLIHRRDLRLPLPPNRTSRKKDSHVILHRMGSQPHAYGFLFDIRRSVRYHERRRAFFDAFSKLKNALGLFAGSGAVGAVLLSRPGVAGALAVIVAAFSAIDLVIGSSEAARRHNDLQRRFLALESDLIEKNLKNTDGTPLEFVRKRLSIEADEPPIFRALDTLCHNEVARSLGRDDQQRVVSPFKRWLANFFSFRNAGFEVVPPA